MPILQNSRHEAFAQARAKGATLEDAYEDAGFTPGNGHACRLAFRPEVAERIAKLRQAAEDAVAASPAAIISALVRMAAASEALASPSAAKEARLNLLEAYRLQRELAVERGTERYAMNKNGRWKNATDWVVG